MSGLPVITTPIGSEGMFHPDDDDHHHQGAEAPKWGGRVARTENEIVDEIVKLYTDPYEQLNAQSRLGPTHSRYCFYFHHPFILSVVSSLQSDPGVVDLSIRELCCRFVRQN